MKFSVNWLREFVELPASIEQLAETLTLAGVEIEAIEHRGANFDKVVVAQILSSKQHPNADRLSVCQVDDGTGKPRQVVCGAKNYHVGDKVPLALPGAVLRDELKIRASKLRGVESEGMLCSGKELGLAEDAAGLLILSPEAQVGRPIAELFPADTILDVEITPNRADLLSNYGLAREIAALIGVAAPPPRISGDTQAGDQPRERPGSIETRAPRECPFYSARRIDGIKVGPSPGWLRARIEAAGLRSINNIVDITNFVMLELGQPLHAFDADKLNGAIRVRLAATGEKFLALDGKEYTLSSADLVIADAGRAVAIGGVMGGEDTGVTEATRNVLLEAAYFSPGNIRRTARSLNLPSDASYRFERGVDPGMILHASRRGSELMREIAGGAPADEIALAGSPPAAPADVMLRYERCDQLLGVPVNPETVSNILVRFGLRKTEEHATGAAWRIPSYRSDLLREADLIEEVVRAYGVEKIPAADRSRFTPTSVADRTADLEMALRQRLVAHGLCEARTSALIPRGSTAAAQAAIEVRNPLSEEHVALRPDLLRGLTDVLVRNQNMGAQSVRLFELGRIFLPPAGKEQRTLGLLFSGTTAAPSHWRASAKRQLDFFDLKGAIEAVRIPGLRFQRSSHPALVLAAEILARDESIGWAGQLGAAGLASSAPVFVAQLNLEAVFQFAASASRFSEVDRFPAVTRDIAMIAPEALSHAEILNVIYACDEPLLEDVQLFDLFSGKDAQTLGPQRKSLAYTLTYRAKNRTLTSDEVIVAHTRIRDRLRNDLEAELRE